MKKICLLFFALSLNPTQKLSVLAFNLDDNIYILEQGSDIAIKTLNADTIFPISCLHQESYALSDIDFSKDPQCLIDTLNQAYHLDIDYYIDFKQRYQMKQLKQIANDKQLSQMMEVYPQCLIDTLNQAYHLDIDYYIDFKQRYQMKQLKQIANDKQLSQMMEVYRQIDTDITLLEAMKQYRNLSNLLKMDIHQEYPMLVKKQNYYYPFAPFEE